MIRAVLAALLVVALAACAPGAFDPIEGAPEGATMTHDDGVYTLSADPPVLRSFLTVFGENLTVDHEDCEVDEGDVVCVFGATNSETVEVGGDVSADIVVLCRDQCHTFRASEPE